MTEITVNTALKPKLAFLGTGWIGLNRMKALLEEEVCTPAGICDLSSANRAMAREAAGNIREFESVEEIIAFRPDGIVIATPNALHYSQCMAALNKGIPVFCQKPLAHCSRECSEIIGAARNSDKLLGIDMSYRFTDGMQKIYNHVKNNVLGGVYSVDLVFHNAYGPDKEWFYDPALSGGGCVIDLGIHLVDLAMWVLGFPEIDYITSALYSKGRLIEDSSAGSEDFASVCMLTTNGVTIRLACSWNLPVGKDAEIKAAFYGTQAAAVFENLNGSFYDFQASLNHGTRQEVISSPPEKWGGKALVAWASRLRNSASFDPDVANYLKVAQIIDRIYGRSSTA